MSSKKSDDANRLSFPKDFIKMPTKKHIIEPITRLWPMNLPCWKTNWPKLLSIISGSSAPKIRVYELIFSLREDEEWKKARVNPRCPNGYIILFASTLLSNKSYYSNLKIFSLAKLLLPIIIIFISKINIVVRIYSNFILHIEDRIIGHK